MKQNMKKLKIKDGFITEEIVKKFEENSPIVRSLKDFTLVMKKIVIIGIIYFLVMCYIQKFTFATLIFILIVNIIIIAYICKRSADVLYSNSKSNGGKRSEKLNRLKQNLDITTYNLKIMQKEELKLLKNILRVNHIKKVETIKELKEYYGSKKRKKTVEMKNIIGTLLSIYVIPITFGIINIYTSIDLNLGVEKDIINIAYIFFIGVIVLSILLILYLILEIRNFSTVKYYTLPKLEKLLLEILIEKNG